MKEQIHELRTRIDGLAQLVKSMDQPILKIINPIHPEMSDDELWDHIKKYNCVIFPDKPESKIEYIGPGLSFLAESYKSLLLSKAWLGKVLAELREETPYKNEGNRKTVEDIEPTSDRTIEASFPLYDTIKDGVREMTYIEKIDWLRQEIQKIYFVIFAKKVSNSFAATKEFLIDQPFDKCMEHLTEARFHLGFELQRIKEQSK